jgi:hypothetical protein
MDFSSLFSSLGTDVTGLAGTATSLLPVATGINNLVNGTPTAPAAAAAAATTTSSWIMYAVLGGIGLIAVVVFLGKK